MPVAELQVGEIKLVLLGNIVDWLKNCKSWFFESDRWHNNNFDFSTNHCFTWSLFYLLVRFSTLSQLLFYGFRLHLELGYLPLGVLKLLFLLRPDLEIFATENLWIEVDWGVFAFTLCIFLFVIFKNQSKKLDTVILQQATVHVHVKLRSFGY